MMYGNPYAVNGSPFLQGMQEAIQTAYTQPTLEQQLTKAILSNKILQTQAQYAPQMTQADLAKAIADANLTSQQAQWYAPKAQSDIGLQGAETQNCEQEAKFAPLKYAIQAANTSRLGQRFGDSYQFSSFLKSLQKDAPAWVAAHADDVQNIATNLTNPILQQQDNNNQQIVSGLLNKLVSPQLSNSQLTTLKNTFPSDNLTINPTQEQISQINQVAPSMQAPNASPTVYGKPMPTQARPITQDESDNLSNLWKLNAARSVTGAQFNNRANNTVQFEQALFTPENRKEMADKINLALDYAGAKGRGQRYLDQWTNQNPNGMAAYDWFTNTFQTTVANSVKYLEQMGATDTQREEIQKVLEGGLENLASNPARAKTAINNMMHTFQMVGDSVLSAGSGGQGDIYRKVYYIPKIEGNYLDTQGLTVPMITPSGTNVDVPIEKLKAALSMGLKKTHTSSMK